MSVADWAAVAVAGLVALLAPLAIRPMLQRCAVLDQPNERSSHAVTTVRGGGLAQMIAVTAGSAVLLVLTPAGSSTGWVIVIVAAAVAAGLLGFAEDVRGVSVALRFGAQLLLGVCAAGALGALGDASVWAVAAAAVFIVAYINIANFMDGLNGMSGLHGAVVGAAFAAAGAWTGVTWLTTLGLAVGVAFLAFLPWNFAPRRLFLGDVGSYLLGGSVAALAVGAAFAGVPLVAVLGPIAIYLADSLWVMLRRAVRGEPILRPHRTHAYQRLTDTGLTHAAASVTVALFSCATAAAGLTVLLVDWSPWVAAGVVVVICAAYLLLPRARGSRLAAPRPTTFSPAAAPAEIAARGPRYHPRRIVVIGTGFVGSALAQHLAHAGLEVVALSAPRLSLNPSLADGSEVDAEAAVSPHVAALALAMAGADAVVNAAGQATPDAPDSWELYGANALLPAVVLRAAAAAGAARTIHISSAAVQGHRSILDESPEVRPFSPYSRSKALGERSFLAGGCALRETDAVVVRATSVQGAQRRTTLSLRRVARSRVASVAAPGTQPTVVSSIDGLVAFITQVVMSTEALGAIMLQPWEGMTVRDVLLHAGGAEPRRLPGWFCATALTGGRAVGRVVPEIAGAVRRVELMWLGQTQVSAHAERFPPIGRSHLEQILRGESTP